MVSGWWRTLKQSLLGGGTAASPASVADGTGAELPNHLREGTEAPSQQTAATPSALDADAVNAPAPVVAADGALWLRDGLLPSLDGDGDRPTSEARAASADTRESDATDLPSEGLAPGAPAPSRDPDKRREVDDTVGGDEEPPLAMAGLLPVTSLDGIALNHEGADAPAASSSPPPTDVLSFDDFVIGGPGAAPPAMDQTALFAALIDDKSTGGTLAMFGERASGTMPQAGASTFTLPRHHLKRVLTLTGYAVDAEREPADLVKLTLMGAYLRAQSCDVASFVECLAPIEIGTDALLGTPIAFAVAHADLVTAARAVEDQVTFTLEFATRQLQLTSGAFTRPIALRDLKRFQPLTPAYFGPEVKGAAIDANGLRDALTYVAPAVRPDDLRPEFTVATLREGSLLGGSPTALAVVTAPAFTARTLKVRRRFLAPLAALLGAFEQTTLFDNGRFYLVSDGRTAFGFEHAPSALPDETPWRTPADGRDRLLAPRALLGALLRLLQGAAGKNETDCLVRLQLKGTGLKPRGTFSIATANGRRARRSIEMARRDGADVRSEVYVPLAALLDAVEGSTSSNVCLDLYAKQRALIVDDDPEALVNMRTILALTDAAKVKRSPRTRTKA